MSSSGCKPGLLPSFQHLSSDQSNPVCKKSPTAVKEAPDHLLICNDPRRGRQDRLSRPVIPRGNHTLPKNILYAHPCTGKGLVEPCILIGNVVIEIIHHLS